MTQPWQTLDRVETPEGPLELRRRGGDQFLITVGGRVLMTSSAHRSEDELARATCARIRDRRAPRLLLGGLGMGYTLRAALDALPSTARITVAELNAKVLAWCQGPLGPLTDRAVADPRVEVIIADVAQPIRDAGARYDAIVFDLYEGPHAATQLGDHPLYGKRALARVVAALKPGGLFAVWSEEPDRAFAARLERSFFVEKKRSGVGGRTHLIYLATAKTMRGRERSGG